MPIWVGSVGEVGGEEARMGGVVGLGRVAGAHALEEVNAMAVIGFLAKAML